MFVLEGHDGAGGGRPWEGGPGIIFVRVLHYASRYTKQTNERSVVDQFGAQVSNFRSNSELGGFPRYISSCCQFHP